MGRRAIKRRHKVNLRRSGRLSDPERRVKAKHSAEGQCSSGWASLDEDALQDYAENVSGGDPSALLDEMEVTRRLCGLNMSVIGGVNDFTTCTSTLPQQQASDADTIYSELPSATLLDSLPGEQDHLDRLRKRRLRKRASKRNRKRTKKQRLSEGAPMAACYSPIAWVKTSVTSDSSQHHDASTDATSSRALTDSDSPTLDDIIMLESAEDDMYVGEMDSQDTCCSSSTIDSTIAVTSHSRTNSDHDLTEDSSTSDSGCEGDDEESSVEVGGASFKPPKDYRGGGVSGGVIKGWWNHSSSCNEDFSEDDEKFGKILGKSLPLLSEGSGMELEWTLRSGGSGTGGEFKHPQQYGLGGGRKGKKKRKKPTSPPLTVRELSSMIEDFVANETQTELVLPCLSQPLCRMASTLAEIHHLTYTHGNQKRRLPVSSPVIRKTVLSRLASSRDVERLIKEHHHHQGTRGLARGGMEPCLSIQVPVAFLNSSVDSVGGAAPPLDDSNVGNVMLRNMGWKPGCGLGPNEDGIQDPITATTRPKHAGLGF